MVWRVHKSNAVSVPKSKEYTCAGSTCDDVDTSSTGLEFTTFIIRNIPKNVSRCMLLEDANFMKEINLVNVPLAYDSFKGFSFAFINVANGDGIFGFQQLARPE